MNKKTTFYPPTVNATAIIKKYIQNKVVEKEDENVSNVTGKITYIDRIVLYKYSRKERKCWLVVGKMSEEYPYPYYKWEENIEIVEEEIVWELPKLSESSFRITFQHNEAELTIQELTTPTILGITLNGVEKRDKDVLSRDCPIVGDCHSGKKMIIWNPEIADYEEKFDLPWLFHLYLDKVDPEKPLYFLFDFESNIVLKPKDENKPWIWYHYDIIDALAKFIYHTLSPHIPNIIGDLEKIEQYRKKIEKLLQELRQLKQEQRDFEKNNKNTKEWLDFWKNYQHKPKRERMKSDLWKKYASLEENLNLKRQECYEFDDENSELKKEFKYNVIWDIPAEDVNSTWVWSGYKKGHLSENYDLSAETKERWIKLEGQWPSLIISFAPVYIYPDMPEEQKITRTKWFLKLWEVFGSSGVPIVFLCYPGFIYKNLYTNYREIFDKISGITKLPPSVSGREIGMANLLVYFNMPFLGQGGVGNRIPWNSTWDMVGNRLRNLNK